MFINMKNQPKFQFSNLFITEIAKIPGNLISFNKNIKSSKQIEIGVQTKERKEDMEKKIIRTKAIGIPVEVPQNVKLARLPNNLVFLEKVMALNEQKLVK